MGIPTKHSDDYAGQLENYAGQLENYAAQLEDGIDQLEDRIAAIEAENKRLREALRPFAKHGQRLQDKTYFRVRFLTHCFPWEMWDAAAKAMEESE